MIDAAAVDYFGEILRQFREEKPELDLHISVGPSQQLLDALTAGKLDLAICVATNAPNFTITPLLEEDLNVYGPLTMRNSPAESWGPWVSFPNGSLTRELIRIALFAVGAPFEVIAESNQPEVLSEMVRIGMGWAVSLKYKLSGLLLRWFRHTTVQFLSEPWLQLQETTT